MTELPEITDNFTYTCVHCSSTVQVRNGHEHHTCAAPRRFYLQRDVDVSGVSGTGRVAEGVLWTDGTVSIRWLGEHPSVVFWQHIHDAYAIHGHDGATRFEWMDR